MMLSCCRAAISGSDVAQRWVRLAGAATASVASALLRSHRLPCPSHSVRRLAAASVPILHGVDLLVGVTCIFVTEATRVSSTQTIFASNMIHLISNSLKMIH